MQSEYVYESFWGNEGRFVGLFMIILYTYQLFYHSKEAGNLKSGIWIVFLGTGMIVCLIGILHYFEFDPIGFKNDLNYLDYVDLHQPLEILIRILHIWHW